MTKQRPHKRKVRKTGKVYPAGRADTLRQFRRIAKTIWGDIIDKVELTLKVETVRPEMAALLSKRGRGGDGRRLIGNHLVRCKKAYTLSLRPEFFELPADQRKKILVHEAVHIGCSTHNKVFHEICLKHGGARYFAEVMKDPTYAVQIKPKGTRKRYKTIKVFKELKAAEAFGREYAIDHKDQQVRFQYQ